MDWNPGRILELSGSYWQTAALQAGVALDIFTVLAGNTMPAAEVAQNVDADPRATAMLLNALTAMGLLIKTGDRFASSEAAAAWLNRNSEQYLGYIIRHHHHLMASWAHLPAAVRSGRPQRQGSVQATEGERESFLLGMFNLASQLAPVLVPQIDLTGRTRLLDLGGGPGTYAIHFCKHNPQLRAVVYDLPTTRPFAEQTIDRFGLRERIAFQDGDFLRDGVEGRFDVAWLSHILHGEGPAGCARIVERAVAALEPGGLILIHEFILDDNLAGPLFPALFSLNMLLGTENGQSYSGAQIARILADAGVRDIRRLHLELPGPTGVIAGIV